MEMLKNIKKIRSLTRFKNKREPFRSKLDF